VLRADGDGEHCLVSGSRSHIHQVRRHSCAGPTRLGW
jgi:hypothetical protein